MTLADILIPLAGSISNEKALKMREACDLLESRVDINQRGTNHAHDLISLLTDRVKELERDNLDRRLTKLERAVDVLDRQRVETLNLRVNGLEHVDRIARLDAEVAQLDRNLQAEVVARVKAHCTCTHEKRMHANALNGCLVSGCRCEKYTGEGRAEGARSDDVAGPSTQPVQASPTGVREGVSAVDEGSAASRQAAPFPASPAPEIPSWVPSVKELDTLWMREALKLRGQDSVDSAWNWIRRLIASRYVEWRAAHLVEEPGFDKGWDAAKRRFDERAPRASTVSVEEMAERLLNAQLKHYGLSPRAWAQVDEEERAYWLALARAAIGGGK